jgi:hypothetical protein
VVDKLAREIAAAPKSKAFMQVLPDYELIGNTPAEFAKFLRRDAEVSAKIIAQAGVRGN